MAVPSHLLHNSSAIYLYQTPNTRLHTYTPVVCITVQRLNESLSAVCVSSCARLSLAHKQIHWQGFGNCYWQCRAALHTMLSILRCTHTFARGNRMIYLHLIINMYTDWFTVIYTTHNTSPNRGDQMSKAELTTRIHLSYCAPNTCTITLQQ